MKSIIRQRIDCNQITESPATVQQCSVKSASSDEDEDLISEAAMQQHKAEVIFTFLEVISTL